MDRATHMAAPLLCLVAVLASAPVTAQDDVTIYRCVDDRGQVSIGNLPCREGQRQETRSMVRPVDGTPPPAPAPAPGAQTVVEYVAAPPPQPLYECVRPDGSTYESDTGDGEPRYAPAWTMGYPVGMRPGQHGRLGAGARGDVGTRGETFAPRDGSLSVPSVSRISIPTDPPRPDPGAALPPRPRPPHGGHAWPGVDIGSWERDACHALPQDETCARLHDRRDELRRRFFNAQERERDTLRIEERGLNARIDRDCRTY